jgi:uncharacterized protein (TIGR01370 family)
VIKEHFCRFGAAGGQTRRAFLAAAAGLLCGAAGNRNASGASSLFDTQKPIRWLAYYGMTADESVLASYDIVVLDSGFQGSISRIAETGARVCGYVSLGEIRTSDPNLEFLDREALLPENSDWPGTRRVDVRHPSWRPLVLDRQIPLIASQGFTGLMLDTLDTPPYLELFDPARYHGMRQAAVELVHSIRARWPGMTLIMNRGYALLPDVLLKVDAILAESLLTSTNPRTGGFRWLDYSRVETQLAVLSPAACRRPRLPILSLDYWDPNDLSTIAEIYRRERELGHHPYVATRLLDRIVPEPKARLIAARRRRRAPSAF